MFPAPQQQMVKTRKQNLSFLELLRNTVDLYLLVIYHSVWDFLKSLSKVNLTLSHSCSSCEVQPLYSSDRVTVYQYTLVWFPSCTINLWINLNIYWKDWRWSSNTLATWCKKMTHLKRLWCWERLKVGGEGDDRGWDGWMASPTWWTWVWVNSGTWWWTVRPGVLRFMGLQS